MDRLRTFLRRRHVLVTGLVVLAIAGAVVGVGAAGASGTGSSVGHVHRPAISGLWARGSDDLTDPSVAGVSLAQALASVPVSITLPAATADHSVQKVIVEKPTLGGDSTASSSGAVGVLYAPDIELFARSSAGWSVVSEAANASPGNFTDGRKMLHEVQTANGHDILVTRAGTQDLGFLGTHAVPNSVAWQVGNERYLVRSLTVSVDELVKFSASAMK